MKTSTVKTALIDAVPVLTDYLFLGMGFGLTDKTYSPVSQSKGLPDDEQKEYCFW